jgi:Zn-dependent protease with chaperone function
MTLLLLGFGLGLLAIPALVRPLGRRLPPSEWARACAGLLVVGWIVVEASLLLEAAPTLLRTVGLERLAELCEHALGPVAPGGPVLGLVAGGAATAVALLAARSLLTARHRQRLVMVEPGIGWHATVGGHELVVLPSGEAVAFSTAGWPGQLVLSQGLIAALSDAELAAVLRHELAHVDHRHQRYLQLARIVERSLGLLPGVRGATGALRCALERWADEEAAGGNATSRASVHAALLRLAELAATPEVAAFTTPGTVAERLDALQADPTGGRTVGRRALVYGPAGLLLGAATATLVGILAQVSVLHALAGLCQPH